VFNNDTIVTARALTGCLILASLAVSGCTTSMDAMQSSIRQLVPFGQKSVEPALDPNFQYLRITRGRHTGWMWLGSTEASAEGPIEVYYSGQGEVLRLRKGHVVGASGLTTEWHAVSVAAPSWAAVTRGGQPASFVRIRDVMPGYRSRVHDRLVLRPVAAPDRSALRGIDPKSLVWFDERLEPTPGRGLSRFGRDATDALPPARYAVDLAADRETVVYAEQCLAHDLCFTWQRWSKAMQSAQAPQGAQK
jgi:hypothetical protein